MELIWLMFPMPNDASTQGGCKQHGQHPAQLLAAFFSPQPVGEVVHRATLPRALLILVPVKDAQHVFGKAGHHAEEGHDPHPEHRPRPAAEDGRCHPHDVAGADGGRQRGAQALELADRLIVGARVGGHAPVGEDGPDGLPHPVPEVHELEKARPHREHHPRPEEQCQPQRSPHDPIDRAVDGSNGLQHRKIPPATLYGRGDRCMRRDRFFV